MKVLPGYITKKAQRVYRKIDNATIVERFAHSQDVTPISEIQTKYGVIDSVAIQDDDVLSVKLPDKTNLDFNIKTGKILSLSGSLSSVKALRKGVFKLMDRAQRHFSNPNLVKKEYNVTFACLDDDVIMRFIENCKKAQGKKKK